MIELRKVMSEFEIYGDFVEAFPYGTGHINDTYKAVFSQAGRRVNYLAQRINTRVFQNPEALMENISRICAHLSSRARAEGMQDASRRVLHLIPSRSGQPWHKDSENGYWRCYLFIEDATGHGIVQNTLQAREAARCFGEYLNLLADLPGKRLYETIPDFHNTPNRFANLAAAVEKDELNLAKLVQKEIDFFTARENAVGTLIKLQKEGKIPERVTHNDTKLNNVLLDNETSRGVCVIDLDTSMPGLSLYDFGDLVRTSTSPVPEDHPRPEEVQMRPEMYKALAEGFLESGHSFLNETEISLLPEGARLMTMEVGMRFLTDYLEGNKYFKTAYPEHNLVRCRTQIALTESIEKQTSAMLKMQEEVLSR